MLQASVSVSHDLPGILHDTKGAHTPETVKSFNRAYIEASDQNTRAVLENAFMWPTPVKLTVCFSGGVKEVQAKIAAAMKEWAALTSGRLEFEFGLSNDTFKKCDGVTKYNIRIGFVKGDGHWSYIGTIGETVFPENTMNLDFDSDSGLEDQKIREITLHETGHALGFHHEHQSPAAPCKNWAWNRILTMYPWRGETEEERRREMEDNLKKLSNQVLSSGQHAYSYTTYDPQSIMHYSFPSDMFTDGNKNVCHVPQATGLSPVDMQAVKDTYATQRAKGQKTKSIEALLAKEQFPSIRELLNMQKQLFPGE